MARLADGDRSVFRAVFSALWPPVHSLCERALGRGADAEDAAQQALEKVFARASSYERARPALPWALGIAAWECRTIRRKAQRARREPMERAETVANGQSSPEEAVLNRELEEAALGVLGELSEADQATLRATFFEGSEERLAVSNVTFRKRRERALSRLRELWGKMYGSS